MQRAPKVCELFSVLFLKGQDAKEQMPDVLLNVGEQAKA